MLILILNSFAAKASYNDGDSDSRRGGYMQSVSNLGNFATGAVMGSYMGSFVVHYWDTLATNYIMTKSEAGLSRFDRAAQFARQSLTWKHTAKTFKSYIPVASAIVPCRALSIAGYGYFQNLFMTYGAFDPMTAKLCGAVGSGVLLTMLSAPAEQVKTMLQLGTKKSLGIQVLTDSYRQYPALAMRIVPTVTCMLFLTEWIQNRYTHNLFGATPLSMYSASILASGISQIIATPFENLRIKQVQQGIEGKKSLVERIKMLSADGILYRGFSMRVFGMSIQATSTLYLAYLFSNR